MWLRFSLRSEKGVAHSRVSSSTRGWRLRRRNPESSGEFIGGRAPPRSAPLLGRASSQVVHGEEEGAEVDRARSPIVAAHQVGREEQRRMSDRLWLQTPPRLVRASEAGTSSAAPMRKVRLRANDVEVKHLDAAPSVGPERLGSWRLSAGPYLSGARASPDLERDVPPKRDAASVTSSVQRPRISSSPQKGRRRRACGSPHGERPRSGLARLA